MTQWNIVDIRVKPTRSQFCHMLEIWQGWNETVWEWMLSAEPPPQRLNRKEMNGEMCPNVFWAFSSLMSIPIYMIRGDEAIPTTSPLIVQGNSFDSPWNHRKNYPFFLKKRKEDITSNGRPPPPTAHITHAIQLIFKRWTDTASIINSIPIQPKDHNKQ